MAKRPAGCSRRSNFQNGSSAIKQVLVFLLQWESPIAKRPTNASVGLRDSFPFIFLLPRFEKSSLDPGNPSGHARLSPILCPLLPVRLDDTAYRNWRSKAYGSKKSAS
ncbi:hypothetical protein KM043_015537 [Ampulex compressa]|nr:hypothetical protein KM043_015537 [Ampulex compressa]